jgi:hypothetical protein
MRILENPAASSENHRPMPFYQGLEGGLFTMNEEAFQKLTITDRTAVIQKKNGAANVLDDPGQGLGSHESSFLESLVPAYMFLPNDLSIHLFCRGGRWPFNKADRMEAVKGRTLPGRNSLLQVVRCGCL